MSIYSRNESGTSWLRTRFTKSISYNVKYDCQFGQAVTILHKFCLPGDVWRVGGDVLVRFQPMLSPSLTPNKFKVRYFFVPLRLLDENTELIITGSENGHEYSGTLPTFPNFVDNADKIYNADAFKVVKHSFYDYLGVQCLDYEPIKTEKCLPAEYNAKAYFRINYDYYDDENIGPIHSSYSDFETFWATHKKNGCNMFSWYQPLRKDYFTSSLPWQLKGTAPVINVGSIGTFTPNFNLFDPDPGSSGDSSVVSRANSVEAWLHSSSISRDSALNDQLNKPQTITISNVGFTADDLRTMMAQTRIFERLARTGSRYTEYLRANFGTSPADGTLQRAQYLGGWSIPIVTTEVLQTAADGSTPVGTMRGHGITRGGNRIHEFHCKEYGLIIGIASIIPNTEYTTGIPRELTYKERFDFFNPSFQHLSEQEVRNGEIFVSNSDNKDDDTFGFQAYANELRSSHNLTVGDMRDSLSYWSQSLHFTSRPNLNSAFISSRSHRSSFNAPFGVIDPDTSFPIIVEFANILDVYRPMVRYSTPGLVDHL